MSEDLDPDLKELFAAEKDEAPPEEVRKRLAGVLASTLALPVPATALTAAPLASTATATVATGVISAAKAWTVAGAAFLAGGAALVAWTAARPPAPVVLSPRVTPTASAAPPPVASAKMVIPAPEPMSIPLDASAPELTGGDAGAAHTSSTAPSTTPAGISAERAVLDDARTAVNSGDYATALGILDRHAHQFPHGQLWEEREALAVDALVHTRDFDQARARGDRLRDRSPNSLFLPMVDAALRSIP